MKTDEIYEAWKKNRAEIEVGEALADEVMRQVRRYETTRPGPLIDVHALIERMSRHRPAKAALIAGGALTGAIRISLVVYALLRC